MKCIRMAIPPKVWTIMSGPSTTGWQGIVKSILRECILLMRVKPSYGRSKGKNQPKEQTDLNRNSIERLNHALDGDFHWRPAKSKLKPYAASCYDAVVARYEAYLIQTGKTITNTRRHIHLIADFLSHMESAGITSLPMIKAGHIHERFAAANDKAGFRKAVKMFFRYACKYGLVENDNSRWIPTVPRHRPIPSVYTKDEIERILDSIDRTTSLGKRNYCMILIAARLGIRSCDIAGLKLEDIRHREGLYGSCSKRRIFPLNTRY